MARSERRACAQTHQLKARLNRDRTTRHRQNLSKRRKFGSFRRIGDVWQSRSRCDLRAGGEREDDAAEHPGRDRAARLRRDACRRQTREQVPGGRLERIPQRAHRVRIPRPGARGASHRARERRARVNDRRRQPERAPRPGARSASALGVGKLCVEEARNPFKRPTATRGDCPRLGGRAWHFARRRTDVRARQELCGNGDGRS